MALQDLTPQLRTRLSRMERAVGWFVILAVFLLAFGFVYYVYTTAERKGWFQAKAMYFTFVDSASGLHVGDPVMLMGFQAGAITEITPMPANQFAYNVFVKFELMGDNIGYMWTEGSQAKVTTELLGKRVLEVTKGTNGHPTYIFRPLREIAPLEIPNLPDLTNWALAQPVYNARRELIGRVNQPLASLTNLEAIAGQTNLMVINKAERKKWPTAIWDERAARYEPAGPGSTFWLRAAEAPPLSDRLDKLVSQVEQALPGILNLTNQLTAVLTNATSLVSNLNTVAVTARPAVSNVALITAQLNHPGALGEWVLPTNINQRLETTLGAADATLTNANTNLALLAADLDRTLSNLADITSNLNSQVQANTNLLEQISRTIVNADDFVQGLKRHWLLRSAFRQKNTNAPPPAPISPLRSPKEKTQE
jgi:ABC-type transporter Mla subunit MlaD